MKDKSLAYTIRTDAGDWSVYRRELDLIHRGSGRVGLGKKDAGGGFLGYRGGKGILVEDLSGGIGGDKEFGKKKRVSRGAGDAVDLDYEFD